MSGTTIHFKCPKCQEVFTLNGNEELSAKISSALAKFITAHAGCLRFWVFTLEKNARRREVAK